jgi:DNA helicase II / ATP-dependent DNA helicase PcrA
LNKNEIQKEQNQLDKTIDHINNHTYYVWELTERKENQLKKGDISIGDDIAYRRSKLDQSLLEKAKNEPYFGRFDTYSNEEGKETFYIGKQGVRDKNENLIVVDWRMPMASVYYNFTPGQSKQSYTIDNNKFKTKIDVDVLQKRELTIKNKKIVKMSQQVADVDSSLNTTFTEKGEELSITDDFLREVLEQSETTGYLKEIIATIQREQDKAIRQPLDRNVIIQGVAGSGKSSIALHRLSFLLFNNKSLSPENVLILGPSAMFISSFKELLPELNLEKIHQSTYQQLMMKYLLPILKEKMNLSYQFFFEDILFPNTLTEEKERIEFKGSKSLTVLIDGFVEELQVQYINRIKPIVVLDERLGIEDLLKIYEGYGHLPFARKVERFLQHVENKFKDILKAKKDEIKKQYDFVVDTYLKDGGLSKEKYDHLRFEMESVQKYKYNTLETKFKSALKSWKEQMVQPDLITIYKQLLSFDVLRAFGEEKSRLFDNYTLKELNYFDLPPLFYLYINLYGVPEQYSHIVIDEAQDFSYLHFAGLKKITRTMTILGDKDQSIFSGYGQNNWDHLLNAMLNPNQDMILTLDTSYRSTKEIIDVANIVLTNQFGMLHKPITPINRKGSDVIFSQVDSGKMLLDSIVTTIEEWKKRYKRIAIIHKDEQKAVKLAKYLKQEFNRDVEYISPEQEVVNSSISVLSSYYSKGMEFDAVILVNVNEESFPSDDLHARLLYVLLTRAQHELRVFYQDTPSPLLDGLIKPARKPVSMFDDIL